jgi:heterotetrameric sarcosine oxidase gamma subunit
VTIQLKAQFALGAPFGTASSVNAFSSRNAALRERTDIGCVLLTAAVDGGDIAVSASHAANVDLPLTPGMINISSHRKAIWLSPRSWLIQCGVEEEQELVTHLTATFPDKLAHAAAFTDYLVWFELSGSDAIDLLTEGTFLSLERTGLPIGNAKRTLVAQIAAVIVHESASVWLVAVERSRARYFADWLIAAVEETERTL